MGAETPRGPKIEITHPDGSSEGPLKMRARPVTAGTVVETRTGGGGGNGDPKERPFEEVRLDVQRGYVSPDGAWRDYGVRITSGRSVDETGSEPRA